MNSTFEEATMETKDERERWQRHGCTINAHTTTAGVYIEENFICGKWKKIELMEQQI